MLFNHCFDNIKLSKVDTPKKASHYQFLNVRFRPKADTQDGGAKVHVTKSGCANCNV